MGERLQEERIKAISLVREVGNDLEFMGAISASKVIRQIGVDLIYRFWLPKSRGSLNTLVTPTDTQQSAGK